MIANKLFDVIRKTSKEFELIIEVTSIVAKHLGVEKVNFWIKGRTDIYKADKKARVFPIEFDEYNSIKSAWHIMGEHADLTAEQEEYLKITGYLLVFALERIVLRQQIIVDPLTGVYNRAYFDIRIREEMERSKRYETPFSMLMIDIDHFKSFNDNYGHQAGDEVLRIVGKILKQSTRASDVVFRYGGEEFSIFLFNASEETATKVAGRLKYHIDATINAADNIRNVIKKTPFVYDGKSVPISFSIGISAFSGLNRKFTVEELIRNADDSLYRAKQMGRDRLEVIGRHEILRILIVDDEVEYTELLGNYFLERGYHVTTVNSGNQALELLSKQEFDVMLLDLRMPGITGLDILHKIPHIVKKMRVMILTAVGDEDIKKVIYEYGACEFLQKPISIEYLNKHLMARILEMRA